MPEMMKNKLHSQQTAKTHWPASDDITHRQCYTSSSLESAEKGEALKES